MSDLESARRRWADREESGLNSPYGETHRWVLLFVKFGAGYYVFIPSVVVFEKFLVYKKVAKNSTMNTICPSLRFSSS